MLFIEWLLTGSVTQLVLAIISKDSRTTLERWVFDINLVEPPTEGSEPCVDLVALRESSVEAGGADANRVSCLSGQSGGET